MCLSVRGFCPKTSTSLQTTLAADAHLAEGQFLLGTSKKLALIIHNNNNNNNNIAIIENQH
jgi:hypothetical protein